MTRMMIVLLAALATTACHADAAVAPGEQASMTMLVPTAAGPTPDCLEGGALVEVVLPGDSEPVTATADVPPVCGAHVPHRLLLVRRGPLCTDPCGHRPPGAWGPIR